MNVIVATSICNVKTNNSAIYRKYTEVQGNVVYEKATNPASRNKFSRRLTCIQLPHIGLGPPRIITSSGRRILSLVEEYVSHSSTLLTFLRYSRTIYVWRSQSFAASSSPHFRQSRSQWVSWASAVAKRYPLYRSTLAPSL